MTNCENCIHRGVCWMYDSERTTCEDYHCSDTTLFLPCKVGDNVYRKGRFNETVIEAVIRQITINGFGFTFKATKGDNTAFSFNYEDFGKTVFLTP